MKALGSTEKQSKKRDIQPEPRPVETQSVNFGDLVLRIEGNGVVESQRTLIMISEATGKVLFAKNNLRNGTLVRENEVAIEIDASEVENDLFALRSDFLNATASILPDFKFDNEQIYKKWYDYFVSLDINRNLPDLPKITNSQEKIKVSARDIFRKYYAVKNQEILLSKYEIRAPYEGFIKSNGIIEGSFVSKGEQLFTLSDARNLELAVPLLVEESNMIDFSSVPEVEIYSRKNVEDFKIGKLLRKETNLDRNSQTLNVYVSFYNNDLNPYFLPGNYVHVKIQGRLLKNVATIPRHLVDNDHFVFTMEEGKLNRQKVELVALHNDVAIIKNSLPNATRIVTTVLQKPLIGMSIRSINEAVEREEVKQ